MSDEHANAVQRLLCLIAGVLAIALPFAGSAGTRGAALILATFFVAIRFRTSAALFKREFPGGIAAAVATWSLLCVASLSWSVKPSFSAGELRADLVYGLAGGCLFFIAAAPSRVKPWLCASAVGTLLAAAGSWLQPDWIPLSVSRHAVDGGPGYFSTHLVLLAPPLIAGILSQRRPPAVRFAEAAVALIAIVGCAWNTQNRAVWGAFMVEIATAIVAWQAGSRPVGTRNRLPYVVGVACIVLVAAAFTASSVKRSEELAHYDVPGTSIRNDLRPRIWTEAIHRIREAPWLGYGFGREILADDFSAITPRGLQGIELRHAHNMFADMALELGGIGLAAFVWMLISFVFFYIQLLGKKGAPVLGITGLAVMSGFIAKNLTDDFFHRHNALAFWCIQGAILGLVRWNRTAIPTFSASRPNHHS